MKIRNYFSKILAFLIILFLSLAGVFLVSNKALATSWSTPQLVGSHLVYGHSMTVDSGDHTHIVYDYGNTDSEVSYSTIGTPSESIGAIGNTKIAQKFTTPSDMDHIGEVAFQQSASGNLFGTVSIQSDNSGQPSGTPIPNGQVTSVTLNPGSPTEISLSNNPAVSPLTTYWLVFEATSGSGAFDGGATTPNDQCIFYNGFWQTSSQVENGAAEDEYFWMDSNKKVILQQYSEDQKTMIHEDNYSTVSYQSFVKLDTLTVGKEITLPDGGKVTRLDDKEGVSFQSGRFLLYHFYVSWRPESIDFFKDNSLPPLPADQQTW